MTRTFPLVLLVAGTAARGFAADSPPLWRALDAGPCPVGFRVLATRDPGRRLDGAARPVQVGLWYPASAASGGLPLRYADYVAVAAAERSDAPVAAAGRAKALAGYTEFLAGNGVSRDAAQLWLDSPLRAVRDAAPAGGRFPIVAIGQGNGGAVPDQALLGEYLASHGYVVLTTPSPVRLGAAMESDRDVLPVAREQAQDLAFALDRVGAEPGVDRGRLALVGYSFGARAVLLLATRPGTRALVSLDGGIGSATAKDWLPASALDRSRVTCPILHVFEQTEDFMRPDLGLLASLSGSPRVLLRVEAMRHLDLITYGMAAAVIPGMAPDAGVAGQLGERLRAVFLYTRSFLDAHVLDSPEGRALLSRDPAESGFRPGLLTLSRMSGR